MREIAGDGDGNMASGDAEHSDAPRTLRYAAFAARPGGGNPAGVVLDARGLDDARMLAIAREVGYSETAFLLPRPGDDPTHVDVRYFSPSAEVPFCGHATVAAAVAYAGQQRVQGVVFHTRSGPVRVTTTRGGGGVEATLRTVPPRVADAPPPLVDEALAALGWGRDALDPAMPPAVAFAGASHLVLCLRQRATLAQLSYDVERLARLMREQDWTTVHLAVRHDGTTYSARNAFPRR